MCFSNTVWPCVYVCVWFFCPLVLLYLLWFVLTMGLHHALLSSAGYSQHSLYAQCGSVCVHESMWTISFVLASALSCSIRLKHSLHGVWHAVILPSVCVSVPLQLIAVFEEHEVQQRAAVSPGGSVASGRSSSPDRPDPEIIDLMPASGSEIEVTSSALKSSTYPTSLKSPTNRSTLTLPSHSWSQGPWTSLAI